MVSFLEAAVEALAYRSHGGIAGHKDHMYVNPLVIPKGLWIVADDPTRRLSVERSKRAQEASDARIEKARAAGTHSEKHNISAWLRVQMLRYGDSERNYCGGCRRPDCYADGWRW